MYRVHGDDVKTDGYRYCVCCTLYSFTLFISQMAARAMHAVRCVA